METYEEKLFEHLKQFVSEQRLARIDEVAKERTKYVTVAVEDIYQPHNASAIMRSAECFGIQELHIVENKNKYSPNMEITKGASKWIDLVHYNKSENNTMDCVRALKKSGYRVVATTPHEKSRTIDKLDIAAGPVALFFGTELEGITDELRDNADELVKIPMYGFTESFNISVSAAICLYDLTTRMRESGVEWRLPEADLTRLKLEWLRNTIQRCDLIEKLFRETLDLRP